MSHIEIASSPASSIAARVAEAPAGGNELGIAIFGPPMVMQGCYLVVEAQEVEMHLNHRGVEIAGSKIKVKASEGTEAAPFHLALSFIPVAWGELVAIVKGVGGSPFVNITAVFGG